MACHTKDKKLVGPSFKGHRSSLLKGQPTRSPRSARRCVKAEKERSDRCRCPQSAGQDIGHRSEGSRGVHPSRNRPAKEKLGEPSGSPFLFGSQGGHHGTSTPDGLSGVGRQTFHIRNPYFATIDLNQFCILKLA